jgi:hypothetical protein
LHVAAPVRDRERLSQQRDRIEQAPLVRLGRAQVRERAAFERAVAGFARGIQPLAHAHPGARRITATVVD